jgi:hypothetical protein
VNANAPGAIPVGGFTTGDGSDQKVNAGDPAACDSGDTSLAGAPQQCAQPLRIKLREIKKLSQNTDACNDEAFMVQGHGYAFDGKVFTVTSEQLIRLDPEARADFACGETVAESEANALAEVMTFLDQNASVKAHVSIRCTPMLALGGAPDLHANALREVLSAYVSQGRVTIDSCLGTPMLSGMTGVFVELTTGCKEGTVPAQQMACMPKK